MPYADYERQLRSNRERQKTPQGKENHRRAVLAYRRRNRKKQAAHNAVARAVKKGRILPMPCIVCGADAQAHHADYDSPLDVIWLCEPHHKEVHSMVKP